MTFAICHVTDSSIDRSKPSDHRDPFTIPAQHSPHEVFNPTFEAAVEKSVHLQDTQQVLRRLRENLPEAERRIFERLVDEQKAEEARAERGIANGAEAMLRKTA
jgi:hypothetical protein